MPTKEEKNSSQKDAVDQKENGKEGQKKQLDDKGRPLTEQDIALFKRYGKGPYADIIKKRDDEIKDFNQKITTLSGIKESDTGLALPSQWNLQ